MGDRTWCTLQILTEPTAEQAQALQDLFGHGNLYGPEDVSVRDIATTVMAGEMLGFSDVNYAEMDIDLARFLGESKLSYAWYWEPGGDYGSGVTLYNAEIDQAEDFRTNDWEIVLTLSEALDPDKMKHAVAWNDFWHRKFT